MTNEHNHDHDHDHNHDHEQNIIQLIDDEGNEISYEIVKVFQHEESEYVVLYQADGSSGEYALIFKVVEDGDEATFETLSDEEFAIIVPIYEELMIENE